MKNIVVAYDGSPGAQTALDHAAALARRDDGHVTAVLAHAAAETYAAQGAWIPAEARAIIADVNQRVTAEVEAAFASHADRLGLGSRLHFETIAGRVDEVLARRARAADLLIVARPADDVDAHLVSHPDQIAMLSGRPILIVPADVAIAERPGPVILAWDGKRAAARAVADALPLIRPGSAVTVLTIGAHRLPRPADELVVHLRRHGLDAEHVAEPDEHRVAAGILAHCEAARAELLVMGAYEHSKFRVDLTGGPTFEVLRRATWPVLMSH